MIDDITTVLITTSPSVKHPNTSLIEETVASIRWHLPTAPILIACDGVRPEQESYRERYSQFVLRMEELCLTKWKNVQLWIEPEWVHQAQLIARAMKDVTTPLLLFTEWDQAFLPEPIPWDDLARMTCRGQVNLVRFMLEDEIKAEWNHLMLGEAMLPHSGLLKTVQWSQRTHLASVEYYRWMLEKHLKPGDRCYLEDRLYGLEDEWETHKLTIFYPTHPRRIVHLDGRGDDVKFDSVLE
jgi:hypothetical protein